MVILLELEILSHTCKDMRSYFKLQSSVCCLHPKLNNIFFSPWNKNRSVKFTPLFVNNVEELRTAGSPSQGWGCYGRWNSGMSGNIQDSVIWWLVLNFWNMVMLRINAIFFFLVPQGRKTLNLYSVIIGLAPRFVK